MSRSIVEFRGSRSGYRCGYCGCSSSKISAGMWAHTMTVQDYQSLIDRGWRRSGKYCYKPVMDKTCCPQYAIRCKTLDFKLNKSHKKVMKRVNKYLNTDVKPGSSKTADSDQIDADVDVPGASCDIPPDKMNEKLAAVIPQNIDFGKLSQPIKDSQTVSGPKISSEETSAPQRIDPDSKTGDTTSKKVPRSGEGADPNKLPCKKAKILRKERWVKKQQEKAQGQVGNKKEPNLAKSLEQFLSEVAPDAAHRLELRLVRSSPRSREFKDTFVESYAIYKKYQMVVHNDPPDKPTESQFTRFLVDSPLKEEFREGGSQHGFGSFHQQYWLDGRLICVGVLDILPTCVSSVYLYYDPDFFFLSPGTYSALREIAFTRKLHESEPSVVYYYMGYYIHSCPKMKYKGQYIPSFLCCPETYTWCEIEGCRPKLDANKYSRFAEPGVGESDKMVNMDLVSILFERQAMPYVLYKAINEEADDEDEVRHYATLVGKSAGERMLLYRD